MESSPTAPTVQQETSDGRFALQRRGSGQPLLLIHSLGTSKRLFAEVTPALEHQFDVVTPDILGHGESGSPRRDFTIDDHAESLVHLMDSLGIATAHVGGTSLGALIALAIAATFPDRVMTLTLNGCPGWHLEAQRMARFRQNAALFVGPDGLPRRVSSFGTVRRTDEAFLRDVNEDVARAGRWFLSSMWAIAAFDIMPRLQRITARTLVLMGEFDYVMPTVYQLTESIRASRLEVIPDAGHLTPFDAPREFARSLLEFLSPHAPRKDDR